MDSNNTLPKRPSPLQWLSGNFRRKLTLFVFIILLAMMGLFRFSTVYMLQPAYQNAIRKDLEGDLHAVADILNEIHAQGRSVLTIEPITGMPGSVNVNVSDEVIQRLEAASVSGLMDLEGRCLEIAEGTSGMNLILLDRLEPRCILHPTYEAGITSDGVRMVSERNGDRVRLYRQQIREKGQLVQVESGQLVMGTLAAEGKLIVIVSANLERVPQAMTVLNRLLLPLSLLLGLIGIIAAWAFSHWFTRPLTRLSAAAKELAKGNYSVRVDESGDDEIGELAQEFNHMAREVERSANLQRDIMANVSHDLRTPLTLIKGYAETVRDLTGDDPQKRTEQLNVIVDESNRLNKLVGSVLELSRVSAGTEKPEMVRFDLAELCEEVAYRYELFARQRGYHLEFAGEEGCYVLADPKLLERALHNLLGNALNHVGEDGYIGFSVKKTLFGIVRVEVSDHGCGILPEDLPHIFDRYYRSRVDEGKTGTGLGLSITKAIFAAHGFNYGVQSTPGNGALFWFEALISREENTPVKK